MLFPGAPVLLLSLNGRQMTAAARLLDSQDSTLLEHFCRLPWKRNPGEGGRASGYDLWSVVCCQVWTLRTLSLDFEDLSLS